MCSKLEKPQIDAVPPPNPPPQNKTPAKGLSAPAKEIRKILGLSGPENNATWKKLTDAAKKAVDDILDGELFTTAGKIPTEKTARIHENMRSQLEHTTTDHYRQKFYDPDFLMNWLINNYVRSQRQHWNKEVQKQKVSRQQELSMGNNSTQSG